MRKKIGLGGLLLFCLLGILAFLSSRRTGDALRITYLGTTTNKTEKDLFGVTNQSPYALIQFGGPSISQRGQNNCEFPGATRHLTKGAGYILEVPSLVPSGKEWRVELEWEFDWRRNIRDKLSRLRPVQNGSVIDRIQDYLLPLPDAAHGEWIQNRFPKED